MSESSRLSIDEGRTAANLLTSIHYDPFLSASAIQFSVKDKTVAISASALSLSQRTHLATVAESIVGVERVKETYKPVIGRGSREIMHDLTVALSIKQQLRAQHIGRRVEIDIEGNQASVYGKVTGPRERSAILNVVLNDPEVESVIDRTTIAPEDDETPWWNRIDDRLITTQVKLAIRLNNRLARYGIQVETKNATVVLSGTVPTDETARLAGQVTGDVPGVEKVVNNLVVEPEKGT